MLEVKSVLVEESTKEGIIDALIKLSDFDADFIGDNVDEYLWDEAKEQGFENNRDYTLNKIKDIKNTDLSRMIEDFLYLWMRYDDYYYQEHDYSVVKDENKNIISISVAYIID